MTQATLPRITMPVAEKVLAPRPRPFKPAIEFVLFLIAGLLLLEPIMTIAGVCDEQNQDIDASTGWTLMPNRTFTYRQEGYSRSTINSHGMRDIERSLVKPPNTYRIAVLGCSQTEGNQVPISQTYCQVLEKQLNAKGGPTKYEVLNFGVSAYTIGQEYLRMKTLALKFKPDLVIFAVRPNALLYMGPSGDGSFHDSRPLVISSFDDKVLVDRHPQNRWLQSSEGRRMKNSRWLRYHSRLWSLLGNCAFALNKFKSQATGTFRRLCHFKYSGTAPAPASPDAQWPELTANQLQAMQFFGHTAMVIFKAAKDDCAAAGARFAVVYLPEPKTYRSEAEASIFQEGCKTEMLPLIDLNPEFDRLEKTSSEPLYIKVHMSKRGHESMAGCLKTHLAQLFGIL